MKQFTLFLVLLLPNFVLAQNIPLSRDLEIAYQLQLKEQLPLSTTAIQPWILQVPDSIVKTNSSWLKRKILREHLISVNEDDIRLTLDPLVNFQGGIESVANKTTYINTRGFILRGKIGEHVSFESTLQENQASLPPYLDIFAHRYHIIPGSGRLHGYTGGKVFDYSMSTGYIDYTPNKHFNFQLGNGKNFIGEGYRSLFLSDESFAYPYLRITSTFWHIKYTNLYTQFQDLSKYQVDTNYFRKKFSTMHILSWDVTKNFNFTFFESIVWSGKDSLARRGFEVSYLDPIILYRPVEFGLGSPDNELMGFMGSYRLNRTTIYGQVMLDEFRLSDVLKGNGMWANKQAFQIGIKSLEPFNINGLFVQTEYNKARPYTYSHFDILSNWGNYNQPLAHPLGANFKEGLVHIRYQQGRWIGDLTFISALYGLDINNKNYGKDIFKSNDSYVQYYNNITGQGLRTTLTYSNIECRYILNRLTHLEAVLGILYRKEKNEQWTQRDQEITLGLRTSIFNKYGAF